MATTFSGLVALVPPRVAALLNLTGSS